MIYDLPRDDRWQTMARASLRDDLHAVHALLTAQVLASTDEGSARGGQGVGVGGAATPSWVSRAKSTLGDITSEHDTDLARMSVGLRVVRDRCSPTSSPGRATTASSRDRGVP